MTASAFFFVAALVCMLGIFLSLVAGIVAMTRGREQDHKTSNKMMRFRVILQGLAIIFLFLAAAGR